MGASHPIESQIVLLAGAQASVTLTRLSDLVSRAHEYLSTRRDEYDREFERIDDASGLSYYLVDSSHWDEVGTELGLDDREVDALRRVHSLQFERAGRRLDRRDEFETAMEIRDVVVTADGR
jgi:hypothetical protein